MALVVRKIAGNSSSSHVVGDIFATDDTDWTFKNQVTERAKYETIGIVTMEDVIEEFLGSEVN